MKKFKTHVILVSDQVVPNVTPVIDEKIKAEKVILCASNRMQKKAEFLAHFFQTKKIEAQIYQLGDAFEFEELQEKFLELATTLGDGVGINVTGGTKLMTIAAQLAFADDFPCFYVIPEKDQIIMLEPKDATTYEIEDKLNLNDFFRIHGYNVSNLKRNLNVNAQSRELFTELLKNYSQYKDSLSNLNFLAAKAESSHSLKTKNSIPEKAWDLLQIFSNQGSIVYYDDNKIEFASKEGRNFCKGFWLEDYTYLALKQVNKEIGLQDFACSIQISSNSETRNEIDAAFLHNNTLYIIECKTARMNDKGTDVLYKLDTIRNYAGLFTKSIAASFKSLNKYDTQRAEDLKIKLIEGQNLNKLSENIINFITTGK